MVIKLTENETGAKLTKCSVPSVEALVLGFPQTHYSCDLDKFKADKEAQRLIFHCQRLLWNSLRIASHRG